VQTTANTIREFIVANFGSSEGLATISVDDDILDVLDSLQVLRLIMELEKIYAIKFDNKDMTPENLGSASKLASFVESKRV
jgi:acyl carrier protein